MRMTLLSLVVVAVVLGGVRCTFRADVTWGFGDREPNAFVCRSRSGELLTQGTLQVQIIRLSGCRA